MIARTQREHEAINAREYPGTRQLCLDCEEPTERCEEDAIYVDDVGPLCPACGTIRASASAPEERK